MRPQEAMRLAQTCLADADPRRWRHVQGAGNRASVIASSVGDSDGTLPCAAWLHDIGYAPSLAVTGFHPLDGARFLESIAAPRRIVDLVAHHSCARLEAAMRGLGSELANFADEEGTVRDALWYCDITTSPDGEPVKATARIREIKHRYGPGTIVSDFITQATPELLLAVRRTEELLAR